MWGFCLHILSSKCCNILHNIVNASCPKSEPICRFWAVRGDRFSIKLFIVWWAQVVQVILSTTDFELILNTTNSGRNMHLVAMRCMTNVFKKLAENIKHVWYRLTGWNHMKIKKVLHITTHCEICHIWLQLPSTCVQIANWQKLWNAFQPSVN